METKLFAGIQTFFQEAGQAACYALSIIKIAERITGQIIDPFAALVDGIEKRHIRYNWNNQDDGDNFFVADPAALLSALTGRPVTVRKKTNINRGPAPREYIVQCWERQAVGKTITHFRLPDWDSLKDSLTVKNGRVTSLRVFRVEG
jgi:hypothetical protein